MKKLHSINSIHLVTQESLHKLPLTFRSTSYSALQGYSLALQGYSLAPQGYSLVQPAMGYCLVRWALFGIRECALFRGLRALSGTWLVSSFLGKGDVREDVQYPENIWTEAQNL